MAEHAVIVEVPLSGEGFGEPAERDEIRRISREIDAKLAQGTFGELDGDEFGGGSATLYLYGPSADELFDAVLPILAGALSGRRATVTLRYGEADDTSVQQRSVSI
ncbi:hypothetical protein QTQ03_08195 [Micromonospora sp. WMMA1363]|uniref:hypothetical protein n=1 Tax=Micromonospora sp. WMMA1363 TaxID=3053985 RepID=UPI00259C9FDA|nr:hypothetical protein [Micromonospora sp. WMMA1363]MDM4719571.1 hypothetical protein [Micromonospora sp. WMMA1363]